MFAILAARKPRSKPTQSYEDVSGAGVLKRSYSVSPDHSSINSPRSRQALSVPVRVSAEITALRVPLGLSDGEEPIDDDLGEPLTGWDTTAGPAAHGWLEIDSRPGSSRGRGGQGGAAEVWRLADNGTDDNGFERELMRKLAVGPDVLNLEAEQDEHAQRDSQPSMRANAEKAGD
eukprot:scaffold15513_cov40-Prasinocladus_malaysianus.AAC.1